jgi:hypothetical protein
MTTKRSYSATNAAGRTFTRKSERTYTHALIITDTAGRPQKVSFAGSEELAHKAARSALSVPKWADPARMEAIFATWTVEVVEVQS